MKTYSKKVVLAYLIIVSLGTVAIGWGLPWFRDYIQSLHPEQALQVIQAVLFAIFLSILPFAFYLLLIGRKVISSERFPPPGARVIKDTPLVEGERARKRGQLIVVFSLILALLSLFGAFYTLHLFDKAVLIEGALD